MSEQRPPRRRVSLRLPIPTREHRRGIVGKRLRWAAVLSTLAAVMSGAPAAMAAPGLPSVGVPLSTLLRAEPALAGGLDLAGVVHQAGTANANANTSTGPSLVARLPHNIGSIVQVRGGEQVLVHRTPGGGVVESLDDRSDAGGQPRAFTVYRLGPRGWLGVSVPAMRGQLGWIHVNPTILVARPATLEIHVSLQRRTLTLLRGGHVVLRTLVVIGAPGSPTPVGHFSVDDKRRFTPADPAYGIGALALSVAPAGRGWQQWRVAIHGVDNLGQLGGTGSLGCVHVPTRELERLLRSVPVGSPVDITR